MKNCPYCGSPGDFYFEISLKTYNRCSGCDLIYKEAHVSYDKALPHYCSDYFDKYSADQMGGGRGRLFDKILDLIEESRGTGRLLDVGTGCGFFLTAAQKRGWKIKGIEPSIQSVEIARGQYGLDIYNGPFQEYDEKGEFDVVTFINVLDHLVKPWKDVSRARLLLRSGGILFLRFPNGILHTNLLKISKTFKVGNFMKSFFVFHEYCFTPKFIRRLLSDQGFNNIVVYNASLSGVILINAFPIFSFVTRAIEAVEKLTDLVSGGRVSWSPSLEVIARKK